MQCEKPALSAVLCDKDIEERCALYMEKVNKKIEDLEEKMTHKADKAQTDKLASDIQVVDGKVDGVNADVRKLAKQVSLIRREAEEQEKSKKNVVIRGLSESELISDETQVEEVLKAIDVSEKPTKIERLGKKQEGEQIRPIRLGFEQEW
jgi:hypothetical protein